MPLDLPAAPAEPVAARRGRLAALSLLVCLAGCKPAAPPAAEPADISRPAQILEVTTTALRPGLRFPGRVRAVQRVELAFNVPGQILEFPVAEGEPVAAGTLIARLDPASFETALDVARAELDAATAEYERLRQLWEKSQAVPRADVDRKRTAMEVARSRFAAAQKELNDTRLTAPFAGVVARRLAERFQNVQAKKPVVSLQSPDQLEIVIHVPERVVRVEPRRLAGFAVFDDLPERRFPVTLKSFAGEADPQTQTYEAVLGLAQPDDLRVLPGMAVEVLPDGAGLDTDGEAPVLIPLAAVAAGADGAASVWGVAPDTGRVSRRGIETGTVQGGDVLVLSGLAPGEQIVTAGVHQLREGMRVHPLAAGL
jgi:RND family efflux transporter MFP subunit